MFIEKILDYKQRNMKQWPIVSNRASECGHICERYLVFNRTRSEEKALPSVELELVFNLGNDIEKRVLKDLEDAGIQIKEQQRAFEWKEYQITGSIDAKIIHEGVIYPLEIKSSSPFVYAKLQTVDDLKHGKYLYLRKYPTQLNLYLLMANQERGLFIFKNKVNGQMKEIWMDIDYDLGEETLKKIERVNSHVVAGTVPDPIEWDEFTCSECGYVHICIPDRIGTEIQVIDDAELLDLLERRERLSPSYREYDEVDSQVKDAIRNRDKLMIGPYFITGKIQKRGEKEFWTSKIAKIA